MDDSQRDGSDARLNQHRKTDSAQAYNIELSREIIGQENRNCKEGGVGSQKTDSSLVRSRESRR